MTVHCIKEVQLDLWSQAGRVLQHLYGDGGISLHIGRGKMQCLAARAAANVYALKIICTAAISLVV